MQPGTLFKLNVIIESREVLTAAVPKIAPLAPTEGIPTRAKFPPRTFLKQTVQQKPIELK